MKMTGGQAIVRCLEQAGVEVVFGMRWSTPIPQMMRYTAPMVFLLEDLIAAMESGREPMSNGQTARHALAQILATHDSSLHDNCKVVFPFEKLDMTPPYRWFGADSKPIDEAAKSSATP